MSRTAYHTDDQRERNEPATLYGSTQLNEDIVRGMTHPDFDALWPSWELKLQAEKSSKNTVSTYRSAWQHLARWAERERPDAGPLELTKPDLQRWLVWILDNRADSTAASYLCGVKSFYRWALEEGERTDDPAKTIPTPKREVQVTQVVKDDQFKALLATCDKSTLIGCRDEAILRMMVDCGLRRAELTRLNVTDADVQSRVVFIIGKGSRRRGPKRRACPFGFQTARALDRYLRMRRRVAGINPEEGALWVTTTGNRLTYSSIETLVGRRGEKAGIPNLHPHMLRHTWASSARKLGVSEGDLMLLGGWDTRAMLDRYGLAEAAERAQESYRQRSVGDQF